MAARFVVDFGNEPQLPLDDGRLDARAFHRNCEPILGVVSRLFGARAGHILDIGSGTGQHVVAFARALPRLTWWPSDPSPAHRRSIDAWRRHAGLDNVMPAMDLDASRRDWPLGQPGYPPDREIAGIVCINVLHIAPWAVAEGLLAAAGRYLQPAGLLVLYGPYAVGGAHTAPSNAAFDAALRAQDPQWGVRDVDDVAALAAANGLTLIEKVAMPANNFTLVLGRDGAR